MNLTLMAATTNGYTRFNDQSLLHGLNNLVMKCLLTLGLALLMLPVWAQDDDDVPAAQDPNVKSKIQAARVAYITDQLALTPEEAEKFWPIYREFSVKRKELRLQNVRRQSDCLGRAIELIAYGTVNVDPLVTHHFSLSELKKAFDMVAGYHDGVIKAIINVSS